SPGLASLEKTVYLALAHEPAKRPPLSRLVAALGEAAGIAPASAGAGADDAGANAEAALAGRAEPGLAVEEPVGLAGVDAATKKRDTPIILGCLLAAGGFLVVLGAL